VPMEMRLDSGPSALSKTGRHERPDFEDTIEQSVGGDPNRETQPLQPLGGGVVSKNRTLHAVLVQLNGPRAFDLFKIDRHHVTLGRMGSEWGDPVKTDVYGRPNFSRPDEPVIAIDDPAVSRQHCKFHTDRDESGVVQNMIIEDLESENGTWINGKMVSRAVLNDRDVITVGETDLLFVRVWDHVRPSGPTVAS